MSINPWDKWAIADHSSRSICGLCLRSRDCLGGVFSNSARFFMLQNMAAFPKYLFPHRSVVAIRNRSSEATLSDKQPPQSGGFEEATKKGDEFLMVARALASDRAVLLIPVWAYVACLVLAAALTRVSEDVFGIT